VAGLDLSAFTTEHIALVIGVFFVGDWIFKRIKLTWETAKAFVNGVLDERLPSSIKQTLKNGGGEIIRAIVRTENEIQTRLHQEETRKIVDQAIKAHEQVEATRLEQTLAEFRAEITDSYKLPRRKR
jgi:hypothetical protein